jgi:hypothetical protein
MCVVLLDRGGEESGVYVSLFGAWMFTHLGEHGNAFIVRPYRAIRPIGGSVT